MRWWGNKSNAVIICYHCRKRISSDELSAGLHDHDVESDEARPAPAAEATAQ